MLSVKENLAVGATNLAHAIALAAHSMIEKEFGCKRVDKIWNSESELNKNRCYKALWLATWQAFNDKSIKIDCSII